MISPEEIHARLERILPQVRKPGRYTGGELNQIVKEWAQVKTHVALVFPDIYDLGMSNLGLAILYDLLNQRSDTLAERAYNPWSDMEMAMRKEGVPLYSLETRHPLAAFDIIGFSLPYETLYTNTLNALDLAGIPVESNRRTDVHPLVIAGGQATFNPEPMHAFIDAFVIGEGEEVIHEIVETHQRWQQKGGSRADLLRAMADLRGVYVPSYYEPQYHPDGVFARIVHRTEGIPHTINKRIVPSLPPPPTRFIVPYVDTVHNRAIIEIMRGCTRGCRFCHAGMVNRPVRERPLAEIVAAIEETIQHTGFEEIGLLSLSSSDYTQIKELVNEVGMRFSSHHLGITLPSLRIETVSVDLMDALKENRRTGFTLAPEAASEHIRQVINKPVSTAQLIETARAIFTCGWTTIKLYFMIGHPSESLEDVQAIVNLCKIVRAEGYKVIGRRASVHVGISTFVPKAHTPFQWVACDSIENIREKQALIRRQLRSEGFKTTWTRPEETLLEAWLARGDRRMSEVIYQAWLNGAKFDAWQEHFKFSTWLEAFQAVGLDPAFYAYRQRRLDEAFPWDHINAGVQKRFLQDDYVKSLQGESREDCRTQCYACGILPVYAPLRRQYPGHTWKCPEVKSPEPLHRFISSEPVGQFDHPVEV